MEGKIRRFLCLDSVEVVEPDFVWRVTNLEVHFVLMNPRKRVWYVPDSKPRSSRPSEPKPAMNRPINVFATFIQCLFSRDVLRKSPKMTCHQIRFHPLTKHHKTLSLGWPSLGSLRPNLWASAPALVAHAEALPGQDLRRMDLQPTGNQLVPACWVFLPPGYVFRNQNVHTRSR